MDLVFQQCKTGQRGSLARLFGRHTEGESGMIVVYQQPAGAMLLRISRAMDMKRRIEKGEEELLG
jgi:hypothetical protein